jgi:hypothetical protein
MKPREINLVVRVSKEERKALKDLSDLDGMSASDVVRQMIRRDHAKRVKQERAA